ncbi:aminotransferase GliI [Trichophyton benhamiae CBS 112371]|uniref:Aminotransferase GliI n=1 Tax=Arthroderma benhamiae (strain ATCC MYA-4681 / CBS 112371) TaxID=663331 RepID=D4B3P5_ARTBC|nr:aminotransferase GliI [Trichophyton benhamiae CBS 112371]EFE29743.1 aminotransferase GliI [Trichophyton benhamiae CBS 112371]
MAGAGLSKRGAANVDKIMPGISAALLERTKPTAPRIDLSTAENWLLRDEIIELTKDGIRDGLKPHHLSYPNEFAGDADLIKALAAFFNKYFHPHIPVEPDHVATAPGAATCLNTFLYNTCEPGEGVLVPAPFWNGFDWLFTARSSAVPVMVHVEKSEDTLTAQLIPALEKAYSESKIPIRGLLLTNPHNPFGQCYPKSVLEDCIKFCHGKGIHYISDEVYALSSFENPEIPDAAPFVSALQIDVARLGCDLSRVHTFWSTSKDFGSNGFRVANKEMHVALALASNTETSSLAAVASTALLTSPKLPDLLQLNSQRLKEAYTTITDFFKRKGIRYIPVNSAPYVFARLVPNAQSWEEESFMIGQLKLAGVVVSSGKAYHVNEEEKGWCRMTFALERSRLEEAIKRMETVIGQQEHLHPANGSIIPHLLLLAAQLLILAGPRQLPGRRIVAATVILTLAVVAQCNRFTNNPGLANLFALAWPHWLSALEKTVFASPGGPENDLWRIDRATREAIAWPALGWRKIKWAVTILLNLRGIRWSYQVKNVPPVAGLDRMSRVRFLIWRLTEFALVILMADLVSQMGRRLFFSNAAGVVGTLDSKYITVSDHRLGWSFLKALTFGLGPYYFINMQYLVVSIVAVALGISRPSLTSQKSLSTITGAFVDAVGIHRGTNASSYTQLWLAFTISGVMHALSQLLMPRPANITPGEIVIGIFLFFPCQAAMITAEDFVIWLWKKRLGLQTPLWAPAVGYVWVVCALWFSLPFAGDAMVRLKMGEVSPLPFTLAAPLVRMIPVP